jgi:dihydrofolate reductase
MRLTAALYITLDGVIQGGGGPEEDRSGDFRLGGWMAPYLSEDSRPIALDRLSRADAFLLGRTTYDFFAGFWPRVPDDNPFARALNQLPKYVVSTTLNEPTWAHTTVLRDLDAVARLKEQSGRELQVCGSPTLVRGLLAHGLVDSLSLLTFPVVLGSGRRLFDGNPTVSSAFVLESVTSTSKGIIVSNYRPDGPPRTGGTVG